MTVFELATYFTTLIAIALAPGPVFLMLMVRAASNDAAGAVGFAFGTAVGSVVIIAAVCFGMASSLAAVPELFAYSKFLLMAYILWLAWGIWKGGLDMNAKTEMRSGSVLNAMVGGLASTFISPYMMILFPLVLPEMVDVAALSLADIGTVSGTTFLAFFLGNGLIVIFAAQLGKLMRSPRHAVLVNRGLATFLVGGGGAMAFG